MCVREREIKKRMCVYPREKLVKPVPTSMKFLQRSFLSAVGLCRQRDFWSCLDPVLGRDGTEMEIECVAEPGHGVEEQSLTFDKNGASESQTKLILSPGLLKF